MQDYAPDPYGGDNPEQRYDGYSGVGAGASASDLIDREPAGRTFGRPPAGVPPPIGYAQEDAESNPVYLRMANAWGAGDVEFDPDTGTWVKITKSKPKKEAAYPGMMPGMPGMPAMPYGMYGGSMMQPYGGMMPGMYPGAMPNMYGGMMPPGPAMMAPPPVVERSSKDTKEEMKREAKREMKRLLRKEYEAEERKAEKEARRRRKEEKRDEEERRRREEDQQRAAREAAEADAKERARMDQERTLAQQAALKRQEHEAKLRAKQLAEEREQEARRIAKEREKQERSKYQEHEQARHEHDQARQRALNGVKEAARIGAHTQTATRDSWLSESSHAPPYRPYEDEPQSDGYSQRRHGRSDDYADQRTPRPLRPSSPNSYQSRPPTYRTNPSSRNTSEDDYIERRQSNDWLDEGYSDSRSVRSTDSSQRRAPVEEIRPSLETPKPLFKFSRSRANSSTSSEGPQRSDMSDTGSILSIRTDEAQSYRPKTPSGSLRSEASRMPSYTRAGQSYTYGSTKSLESEMPSSSASSSRSGRPSTGRSYFSQPGASQHELQQPSSQHEHHSTRHGHHEHQRSHRSHERGNEQSQHKHHHHHHHHHKHGQSSKSRHDGVGDWDFEDTATTGTSAASSLPYKMERLQVSKKSAPKPEPVAVHIESEEDDEEAIYVREGRSRSMTSTIPSSLRSSDAASIRSGRSAHSYLSARPSPARRYT